MSRSQKTKSKTPIFNPILLILLLVLVGGSYYVFTKLYSPQSPTVFEVSGTTFVYGPTTLTGHIRRDPTNPEYPYLLVTPADKVVVLSLPDKSLHADYYVEVTGTLFPTTPATKLQDFFQVDSLIILEE